jgi:hypothetical protein
MDPYIYVEATKVAVYRPEAAEFHVRDPLPTVHKIQSRLIIIKRIVTIASTVAFASTKSLIQRTPLFS